jgi:hypothetical protein
VKITKRKSSPESSDEVLSALSYMKLTQDVNYEIMNESHSSSVCLCFFVETSERGVDSNESAESSC